MEENKSAGKDEVDDKGRATEGNVRALKWKTSKKRMVACREYCEYLKTGKPKEYYPKASPETIKSYQEKYPIEFDTDMIEEAEREGLSAIISVGYNGMLGKIPGFSSRTWEFIVQNMTHWKLRSDFTSKNDKMEAPIIYIPEEKE